MTQSTSLKKGHPIVHETLHVSELEHVNQLDSISKLEQLYQADFSLLVVKDAIDLAYIHQIVSVLESPQCDSWWLSPNRGMPGGELRTIGHAATPTFTAFGTSTSCW